MAFKKTQHYHIQNIAPVNGSWIADPVATASMQAVVAGDDITATIQHHIENGVGADLKKYYQYATRRFKKRNPVSSFWTSNANTDDIEYGLNESRIASIDIDVKDKKFRIVTSNTFPVFSGVKVLADLAEKYGIDRFNTEHNGVEINITGLNYPNEYLTYTGDIGNTWVVGETENNVPVVILDSRIDPNIITSPYHLLGYDYIAEPSAGVVYWVSSNGFELTDTENLGTTITTSPIDLPIDSEGRMLVNIESDWSDVTNQTTYYHDDEIPYPDNELEINITTNVENISYTYLKLSRTSRRTDRDGNVTITYYYSKYTEKGIITYDEERFIWATDKKQSHKDVRQFLYFPDKVNIRRNFSNLFKFYPYLPIKEFEQHIFDYSKAKKLLDALKEQSGKTQDLDLEADAPLISRQGYRKEAKERKNSGLSKKSEGVLRRSQTEIRKIKINPSANIIQKSDLRHLEKMGDLLHVDIKNMGATFVSGEGTENAYFSAVVPSVSLGSNFDEVNEYWYYFWKRIHRKTGAETILNFQAAVDKLSDDCRYSDIQKLPMKHIECYFNNPGQYGQRISYVFTREFEFTEQEMRKTKRKRKLCEVIPGYQVPLYMLDGKKLKEWLKSPPIALIERIYHTGAQSKKDYPIRFKQPTNENVTMLRTLTFGGSFRQVMNSQDQIGVVAIPSEDRSSWYRSLVEDSQLDFENVGVDSNLLNPDSPQSRRARTRTTLQGLRQPYSLAFGRLENTISSLAFNMYDYTFFCKSKGNGKIHCIAVAGLVGSNVRSSQVMGRDGAVTLDGVPYCGTANRELRMFYQRNYHQFVERKLPKDIQVNVGFTTGGSKNELTSLVSTFFLMPLDYRTVCRMPALSTMRLAGRASNTVTWYKQRVRKLRGWIQPIISIIAIIVSIYTGGAGGAAVMTAAQVVKQIVIGIIVSLLAKPIIKALVKVLGLKGLLFVIIAIVIMIIAGYVTDLNPLVSSLPMANTVTVNSLASNLATEAATAAANSFMEMMQEFFKEIISQFTSGFTGSVTDFARASLGLAQQLMGAYNEGIAAEIKEVQSETERLTKEYNDHMADLMEIRESDDALRAPYDVNAVMRAMLNKSKIIDPDTVMQYWLDTTQFMATEDYVSQFIEMKLNLEPMSFNPVGSLDFNIQPKDTNNG